MFGSFDEIFNKDTAKPSEPMSPCWRCGSDYTYIELIASCEPELYTPYCLDCGATLDQKFYDDFDEAEKAWNDKFREEKL